MNVNNKNREDRVNPVQDAMTNKNLHQFFPATPTNVKIDPTSF